MSVEVSPLDGSLCGSLLGHLHREGTKPNQEMPLKGKNAIIGKNKSIKDMFIKKLYNWENATTKEHLLLKSMDTISQNKLSKYHKIRTGVILLYYLMYNLIEILYEFLLLEVIVIKFIGNKIIICTSLRVFLFFT